MYLAKMSVIFSLSCLVLSGRPLYLLSIISSFGKTPTFLEKGYFLVHMAGIFKSSSFGFEVKISQFLQ